MTNEEAIECNKNLRMYMKVCDKNQPYKFLEENYIALDMAIKALEQQTCEDTISRSEALSVFRPKGITEEVWKECDVYKKLTALRSVTPKPKIVRCSQCKYAEVADPEDSQDGYTCQFHRGSIWFSGSYCSWAERRQDG